MPTTPASTLVGLMVIAGSTVRKKAWKPTVPLPSVTSTLNSMGDPGTVAVVGTPLNKPALLRLSPSTVWVVNT